MSRGSSIDRIASFFRDSSIDTARVTFQLVKEIVESRLASAKKAKKFQDDTASTPRHRRRTKAEMAQARGQMSIEEKARATGQPGSIQV